MSDKLIKSIIILQNHFLLKKSYIEKYNIEYENLNNLIIKIIENIEKVPRWGLERPGELTYSFVVLVVLLMVALGLHVARLQLLVPRMVRTLRHMDRTLGLAHSCYRCNCYHSWNHIERWPRRRRE